MRRIKSAPANIAEMVNRKKIEPSTKYIHKNINKNINTNNNIVLQFFKNSHKKLDEKSNKNIRISNVKLLNTNTERVTSIVGDITNDIFSLSFEETAFLGIILNLLNNTFRKDKLKDLTAILVQNFIKYLMMFYIHHYILNDYIDKHSAIKMIDLFH